MFVAPALYLGGKRLAVPFVLSSCMCFAAGAYFAFTYVFPIIFTFLINYGIGVSDVKAMLSPPDLFSQVSIVLPFIVLYEVGVWVARFFGKKKEVEPTE
jgi:sec-independent protein translocase protein TatC